MHRLSDRVIVRHPTMHSVASYVTYRWFAQGCLHLVRIVATSGSQNTASKSCHHQRVFNSSAGSSRTKIGIQTHSTFESTGERARAAQSHPPITVDELTSLLSSLLPNMRAFAHPELFSGLRYAACVWWVPMLPRSELPRGLPQERFSADVHAVWLRPEGLLWLSIVGLFPLLEEPRSG